MPEGARPVLFGFETSEAAGGGRRRHHRRRHHSGRDGIHGQAGDRDLRGFRPCRLSARCRRHADHRGRGLRGRDRCRARHASSPSPERHGVTPLRESKSAMETAAIWKGRKSAFGATGRIADYICMDGMIPTGRLPEVLASDRTRSSKRYGPARRQCLPCRRRQSASARALQYATIRSSRRRPRRPAKKSCKLCVEVGGCLTGEHGVGIEKRELMPVQFTGVELDAADARARRLRSRNGC